MFTWIRNKAWSVTMTMTEWLTRTFWAAFARWVERDPAAAEARISAIMESQIEKVVAAQEAAIAAEAETVQ
jgi:hypothetical protein